MPPSVIHSDLLIRRQDIPRWLVACGYKRLAEIGVREGKHLQSWAAANPTVLLGVDLWADDGVLSHNDMGHKQAKLEQMYQGLCSWATVQPFQVNLWRSDSAKAAIVCADGDLDFVYLDADHTYTAIAADIAAWWPKVRVGGTLAGHDYVKRTLPNGISFGVIQAVTEFCKRVGVEKVHTTAPVDFYASWFVTKTKEMPA